MNAPKYTVWLGQVIPGNAEAMAVEQRMKLLEIVRPTLEDWKLLSAGSEPKLAHTKSDEITKSLKTIKELL